jgi:hypothetical protein
MAWALDYLILNTTNTVNLGQAHPFLPCSVSYAASFLMKYGQGSSLAPATEEKDEDLQHLLGLLQRLREVNNLARDVLDKLGTDGRLGSNYGG